MARAKQPAASTTMPQSNGTPAPAPAREELLSEAEFDRKHSRRLALIEKRSREGLSPLEASELASLQAEVGAYLNARFPPPPLNWELLRELNARLGLPLDLFGEK